MRGAIMALIKPKLDFTNMKVTLWHNIVKMFASSTTTGLNSIYPYHYVNQLNSLVPQSRYFHPDYVTVDVINNLIKSTYDCEASGKLLGGNSTISTIDADPSKQCLMPASGTTIESFQFYLSIIGQTEAVLSGPRPYLARKNFPISNIVGLDYSRWIACNSSAAIELATKPITPALISGIITSSYYRYADVNLINANNTNYAKVQNATGNNFRVDQIPESYPLPLDCLGGKLNKTRAEVLNEYLKLYQKAYQLAESQCYQYKIRQLGNGISINFVGFDYKTNSTTYDLIEVGNQTDGWVKTYERSTLNGDESFDSTLWDPNEFINNSGSVNPGAYRDIRYYFTRTDFDLDWSGIMESSLSSSTTIVQNIYYSPYANAYNPKLIINLTGIVNKDIELYCEVHLMVVGWCNISTDSKFQTELNETETGTIQEQKRTITTVNYQNPIGTNQTQDYRGTEEEIKAFLIHDENYMLNATNVIKNNSILYKEATGTPAEKFTSLGAFDGETNPYGLIKISGVGLKTEAFLTSIIPSDIPSSAYVKPATVMYELFDFPTERGEDRYSYNSGLVNFERRITKTWYQKINGQMIPLTNNSVYDSQNFSFDFSD